MNDFVLNDEPFVNQGCTTECSLVSEVELGSEDDLLRELGEEARHCRQEVLRCRPVLKSLKHELVVFANEAPKLQLVEMKPLEHVRMEMAPDIVPAARRARAAIVFGKPPA